MSLPRRIDDLYLNAELTPTQQRAVSRRVQSGELRRISAGIATSLPPEEWPALLTRERLRLLAALFPGAVVGYRTAFDGSVMVSDIFLNYGYNRVVELPGMRIHLVKGAERQPDDNAMGGRDLYFPSMPRLLLDNLSIDRSGKDRNVPAAVIEERLVSVCQSRGEDALNQIRDNARALAPLLGREREFRILEKMIGVILGSRPAGDALTPQGKALSLKQDGERLVLFDKLIAYQRNAPYLLVKEYATSDNARRHFAFLESYFSNFIEGTEFEIEEARDIVMHGKIVEKRPKDSHDILGVFRQAYHPTWRAHPLEVTEAVLEQLQTRHRDMMQARPETDPGQFKLLANVAGNTRFVAPEFVRGTLVEAVKRLPEVPAGLPRALLAMFIVAEIHPFSDGNGRLARIMMNAELTQAGEGRIIVPTLLRDEYVDSLRMLTREGDPTAFVKVMREAQIWSASFSYEDLDQVIVSMRRCNAFEKSRINAKLYAPDGTQFGKLTETWAARAHGTELAMSDEPSTPSP